MVTQKKIIYKEPLMIEYKKIDQLLNEIIYGDEKKQKGAGAPAKNDFKKWIMPEEPKGFLKYKEHDPL
ncbi:MAG: hypothetical protein JST87_03625 [Bacteroidetes bacterium]|nr:hypothetical protein [Bacteroidota bacterium]MBS1935147.1 hypothetical protein [Bacteroidota bacterium]